jgi:hypothetical protein
VTFSIDGVIAGTAVADGTGHASLALTSALSDGAHAPGRDRDRRRRQRLIGGRRPASPSSRPRRRPRRSSVPSPDR